MGELLPTGKDAERCASAPAASPVLEALPGRQTDLGGLPIRRLLPRSRRRLVGAWCFCDSFGPLSFSSEKPMDVPPHPHIGLQTVSWLLEGEVMHHDSLGREGLARPGVLNLMTAGRGIAHAEETPAEHSGRLRGVQLWIALPYENREIPPSFEQHDDLPEVALGDGKATVIVGTLGGVRSRASTFSPLVGAEISGAAGGSMTIPLERDFEHALIPLEGSATFESDPLSNDTLYYLGCGRQHLRVHSKSASTKLLLLGGAPFGETVLMWWNFVARTTEEIRKAREDWQSGEGFGPVPGYRGTRLEAPPYVSKS